MFVTIYDMIPMHSGENYEKIMDLMLPMGIELLGFLKDRGIKVSLVEIYHDLDAISSEVRVELLHRLSQYVRSGFVKKTVKGVNNPPVYEITDYGKNILEKFKELTTSFRSVVSL